MIEEEILKLMEVGKVYGTKELCELLNEVMEHVRQDRVVRILNMLSAHSPWKDYGYVKRISRIGGKGRFTFAWVLIKK